MKWFKVFKNGPRKIFKSCLSSTTFTLPILKYLAPNQSNILSRLWVDLGSTFQSVIWIPITTTSIWKLCSNRTAKTMVSFWKKYLILYCSILIGPKNLPCYLFSWFIKCFSNWVTTLVKLHSTTNIILRLMFDEDSITHINNGSS